MKKSFYETIKNHSEKISFHTPGHSNTLSGALIKLDTTELIYSDNLLNPKGIIKALENSVKNLYKSKFAFISTNGATNSIMTAVYAARHKGDYLIVKAAHKSVYNAVRLAGKEAYYTDNLFKNKDRIPKNIGSIIVTSPDYFGNTEDLLFYRKLADEKKLLLIIDSSHGSHFIFNQSFPLPATEYGDLVVHSLHKTLPVATGGAVLLCNDKEMSERCSMARKIFHSTSPSYIIMASIDKMIRDFGRNGERMYDNVYKKTQKFKQTDMGYFICEKNDDFSRLVISGKFLGKSVSNKLFQKGIAVETSYENKIVAIVTPFNAKYLKKLAKSLKNINIPKEDIYKQGTPKEMESQIKKIEFNRNYELIDINNAIGKKVYNEIGIYPPGTPLIKSGQILTDKTVKAIYKNKGAIFGLESGMIPVIKYNDGGNK